MKTYSAIKAEIAKLEKQAEALRKTEVAGIVSKIKAAIAAYALTAADLGLGRSPAKAALPSKAKSSKKTTTTTGVPKYRDPKTGKTWTGRGKPPAWIAGARNRVPYLIDGQAANNADGAPASSRPRAPERRVSLHRPRERPSAHRRKGPASAARRDPPP